MQELNKEQMLSKEISDIINEMSEDFKKFIDSKNILELPEKEIHLDNKLRDCIEQYKNLAKDLDNYINTKEASAK